MSEMRHERPGVYSVYDASSVTSAGRAAKRIGVAALAVKGTANTAVTLTGYGAGVEVFGEDGADTPGMSTLLKLLFANGASTVYAVRVGAGGGLEAYQAAFAALANCDVQVVVCDSSELTIQKALKTAVETASAARGERIGVIGMGSSVIGARPESEIIGTVRAAVELGVNCFDMAGGHAAIFDAYGKALQDLRDRVYLQVHFGADYTSGEYGWTTDLEGVKRSVDWQLRNLKTDYIDFGFIHCIDEASDLVTYEKNGVLDYLLEMKRSGVVHHLGLSSHTPALVEEMLDRKFIDVVMFSVNPIYDYGKGDYGIGGSEERNAMYAHCQRDGVGITVMKPFCGGQLLDAARSPFGKALTKAQCIQYALDKPGVLTVLPGYGSEQELREVLDFFETSAEERDYSCISAFTPEDSKGKCVYCKHCQPCPVGLDIGLINKYYDLARLGDGLAKEHYLTLEHRAEDCVGCGHCDSRCPFHVAQSARMQEIQAYFGA